MQNQSLYAQIDECHLCGCGSVLYTRQCNFLRQNRQSVRWSSLDLFVEIKYLPVRSMRQGYAFVSVGMCVCVCVCGHKNTPVCVLPLETLHKNTLCSFFTEFIVL